MLSRLHIPMCKVFKRPSYAVKKSLIRKVTHKKLAKKTNKSVQDSLRKAHSVLHPSLARPLSPALPFAHTERNTFAIVAAAVLRFVHLEHGVFRYLHNSYHRDCGIPLVYY